MIVYLGMESWGCGFDSRPDCNYFIARWSRGLGRLVFIQKDIGSNPIRVTLITKDLVAQSVEHHSFKVGVVGS